MYKVKAYLNHNVVHEFDAESLNNGREIAKRIITEGLWTKEEEFFPITQVFKVKILNE